MIQHTFYFRGPRLSTVKVSGWFDSLEPQLLAKRLAGCNFVPCSIVRFYLTNFLAYTLARLRLIDARVRVDEESHFPREQP